MGNGCDTGNGGNSGGGDGGDHGRPACERTLVLEIFLAALLLAEMAQGSMNGSLTNGLLINMKLIEINAPPQMSNRLLVCALGSTFS